MSDAVLMIAARVPTPGQTKTRLGEAIGMEVAARFYACFLQDLAAGTIAAVRDADIAIAWTYSPPNADFAATLDALGIDHAADHLVPQQGADWGTRQDNLLRWAADAGYGRGILIASDSPHLGVAPVLDAFDSLETADAVIGRVLDGGYYLIGMRGHHDILRTVPMSTATAADALVANAIDHGLTIAEVETTFDIDTVADLAHLTADHAATCPRTWTLLHDLGLGRRCQAPS